jgi:uncharacterized protein (DUF1499 family)
MTLRRLDTIAEPMSRLAIWSLRIAVFAVAVLALGIVVVRGGYLDFYTALTTVTAGLLLAVLAILVALAAAVAIWRAGIPGAGRTTLAFLIGLSLIAWPAALAIRASSLPMLNDVTTDPADPPRFERIAGLRPPGANPATYPGAATFALQQAAYPRIEPLLFDRPVDDAMNAAVRLVTRRGWTIVEQRSPGPQRDGRIEAVARTALLGMRDDIVIRLRRAGEGTRVDIRSASRYGRHDLGANAARVDALLTDLATAMQALRPD